jgi:hypothetical protein
MPRDNAYLVDILDSARIIQQHLFGLSREQFLADVRTQPRGLLETCVEAIAQGYPSGETPLADETRGPDGDCTMNPLFPRSHEPTCSRNGTISLRC